MQSPDFARASGRRRHGQAPTTPKREQASAAPAPPLRVGIALAGASHARDWPRTLEVVTRADALGLHSVWLPENHFTPGATPTPLVALAAFAARTRRLRLATSSLLLPLHPPLRLATEIATLDLLSGGRVWLGLGRGFRAGVFEGFGIRAKEKRDRFDAALDAILNAWAGSARDNNTGTAPSDGNLAPHADIQTADGNFAPHAANRSADGSFAPHAANRSADGSFAPHAANRSADGNFAPHAANRFADGSFVPQVPRPLQRPHPPLLVAAFGPKGLAQAARRGLPYLASPLETLEALEHNYALWRELREREAATAAENAHAFPPRATSRAQSSAGDADNATSIQPAGGAPMPRATNRSADGNSVPRATIRSADGTPAPHATRSSGTDGNPTPHATIRSADGGPVPRVPVLRNVFVAADDAQAARVRDALRVESARMLRARAPNRVLARAAAGGIEERAIIGVATQVEDEIARYRERLGLDLLIARVELPGATNAERDAALERVTAYGSP